MKIDDNHLYHGSALIQIAEHKLFTAINSLKAGSKVFHNAYKINNDIGVYLKYGSKPKNPYKEYNFTFSREHQRELRNISKRVQRVYLGLVCVQDREICCLSYDQLNRLITARRHAAGKAESQYTVLVTVPKGKSFRVYVNSPGVKNTILSTPLIVRRRDYPNRIFH